MEQYNNELIVIKVGTSTLEYQNMTSGVALAAHQFGKIALQAEDVMAQGASVAIVSSAAIAAGHQVTGTSRSAEIRQNTREQQRLALIGQNKLMQEWTQAFTLTHTEPRNVGQALFTRRELETPEANELANVSLYAMSKGDVVIANENDALSHEEISFGDNDRLAAHFAVLLHKFGMFKRTRLVILSDIHGVYADKDDWRTLMPRIDDIDSFEHVAQDTGGLAGTGGMTSKFMAARIAVAAGIDTYITHGSVDNTVQLALNGAIGTKICA